MFTHSRLRNTAMTSKIYITGIACTGKTTAVAKVYPDYYNERDRLGIVMNDYSDDLAANPLWGQLGKNSSVDLIYNTFKS